LPEEFFLDESHMQLEFDANGVTYSPSPKFLNKFNDKKQVKSTEEEPKLNSNILTANATYYIFKDYANLGWGIASGDLNGDGTDDMVTGAPVYSLTNAYQNGIAFVVLSKNGLPLGSSNLEDTADFIIHSPDLNNNNSRFGHAIAILDLNQDGYNDIAISAPSYNLGQIKYQVKTFKNIYLNF
jgi:glycosylphosphatidylinositol phospholipase D